MRQNPHALGIVTGRYYSKDEGPAESMGKTYRALGAGDFHSGPAESAVDTGN